MWFGLAVLLYFFLFLFTAAVLLKIYFLLTTGRHNITKSLKGKVVVITGGTAGIGKETVRELAAHDATIHVLARDLQKAERVISDIKTTTGNKDITVHYVDLSDFSTVRAFAKKFLETKSPIHVLINNAGLVNTHKRITIDGNEEVVQANHLSHFLLTNLLLDRVVESAPSRIINVSSVLHRYVKPKVFDVHDLNFEKIKYPWDSMKAYPWTKLMNVLFTRELARRLHGTRVTVNVLHPGVVRTEITRQPGWKRSRAFLVWLSGPLMKSSLEGAQTTLYLATSDEVENVSGQYFADCKPSHISLLAADDRLATELWNESERLTGLTKS